MLSNADNEVLNVIFNPSLPGASAAGNDESASQLSDVDRENEEAKRFEALGVRAADEGKFDDSIAFFTQAIQCCPQCPSGYNNRAQALRLKGDIERALQDLNEAIRISNGLGRAACQAFTQRAIVHRLSKNEEAATEDFTKAASLGSAFAKSQLVLMNPYAALCNKVMSQILSTECRPPSLPEAKDPAA